MKNTGVTKVAITKFLRELFSKAYVHLKYAQIVRLLIELYVGNRDLVIKTH